MPRLLGVTGKPGTCKTGAAKEIIAELRERGYTVDTVSLAAPLLEEMKTLIPRLRGADNISPSQIISRTAAEHHLPIQVIAEAQSYAVQDLGASHPQHGYSRSNDYVRKVMSLVVSARRDQDQDYYLDQIMYQIDESDADWVVCTDIRFPNEADFFNDRGYVIRFERDHVLMDHFATENDGMKYDTRFQDNDPIESALDLYDEFYGRFLYRDFVASKFVDEIIDISEGEMTNV